MKSPTIARQLEIEGVVQGVGFRPFLFVLAKTHHLKGEVYNSTDGVRGIVEGTLENIENFTKDIFHKQPLLASVKKVHATDHPLQHFSEFKIVISTDTHGKHTLISPDVSICSDCLIEMQDPSDRRFEYPFINCTNCGPRFTIIEDIPYDRPTTSMKNFIMCDQCQKEYDNPMDRRFHAQPNACPDCGPRVFLMDNIGKEIDLETKETICTAAKYLNQGKILGTKGLGGFHIACDAANMDAVKRLREKKSRPHKPFALMAKSIDAISAYVHVSDQEKQLLESYHRPIVLLKKRKTDTTDIKELTVDIAPLNTCLGVMLPYTPLHYLLLEKGPAILVMTSGNRPGDPLSIENHDALNSFSHIADYFLLHNRDIYFRADDSILKVQADKTRFIRRSRGYAPLPITLKKKLPKKILGCGAGLKNTICLGRNKDIFLSQHIGNLETIASDNYFQTSIAHLKQIFDIQPDIIAHDLHPGYMSTAYAMAQPKIKKVAVQHHHAHAVACMAENSIDENVIAITLDGTGYGTDGHIWGGEILLCTQKGFKRKAHLSYLPMPGGDHAVIEPWRMAASILHAAFGKDFLDLDIAYIKQMKKQKLAVIYQMIQKQLNSPLTSSAGRIFDAIASLLCIRHKISYESQAAMELEAVATIEENEPDETYDFKITSTEDTDEETNEDRLFEMDLIPGIPQIVTDLKKDEPISKISLKFHHTLVALFVDTVVKISEETGIQKIVLSGGVFNNDIIFKQMIEKLEVQGFMVFTHTQVPTGDGGICLGQVVVAAAQERS